MSFVEPPREGGRRNQTLVILLLVLLLLLLSPLFFPFLPLATARTSTRQRKRETERGQRDREIERQRDRETERQRKVFTCIQKRKKRKATKEQQTAKENLHLRQLRRSTAGDLGHTKLAQLLLVFLELFEQLLLALRAKCVCLDLAHL